MAQIFSPLNVCLFGAGLYAFKKLLDSRKAPLPPGPSGWPLIGNILDVPAEKKWQAFAAFGKKYGDISSINALGTRYVILNSHRAVSEVIEKQSIKCSGRPHLTMLNDLIGSRSLIILPYDERFKQYRRYLSRLFGTRNATSAFHSMIEEEARRFIVNVAEKPDVLATHVRLMPGAVILKVIYGYSTLDNDDPFIEVAKKVVETFTTLAAPGAYLVDLIPALRYLPEWLPGTGFLQDAKKYRPILKDALHKPHEYVLDQMAAGTAVPSFASTLLSEKVTPEEEDIIMWTSLSAFIGASDTTVAAVNSFFLAMVIFPDVQAKGQAELDAVVGPDRLPTLQDRNSLPYVNAICKEVLRWHVVAPLGTPHVATEDIYTDGYLIPKGSYVIENVWGILQDENTYPDPSRFHPERYIGSNPQPDPQIVCFGGGRRICPGLHVAEATIFMSVAMSLAALNISRKAVNGVEVIPQHDLTSGLICHAKPFDYKITPRFRPTSMV